MNSLFFNVMYDIFPIIFIIVLVFIIGYYVYVAYYRITRWNKNNHSPKLSVHARVVSKRADVSTDRIPNASDGSGTHGYRTLSSTYYYITFQVDSGDRVELEVNGGTYGVIAEGDDGILSFQGTRFLDFKRL